MKVYIIEDNDSMRLVLKRLVRKNFPSISKIGESDTAERALEEIPGFNPDLILVDISLPGIDGIEMIRKLKPECKNLCILVVTAHEVDIYKNAAEDAGAHGIVSKSSVSDLLMLIETLLAKRRCGGC